MSSRLVNGRVVEEVWNLAPASGGGGGGGGGGDASAANQETGNTSLASIDADLGALADAPATSDAGAFSVIALIKRGLENWTSLLGRVPAAGQKAMAASMPVVLASDQSTVAVVQPGASASGTLGALNANVALALNGASGFAVDLRNAFTGTITFQGTIDGTNWFPLAVIPAGSGANTASVTTATAAGAWVGNANGLQQVRANCTAYTSGSLTAVIRATSVTGLLFSMSSGATAQPVSGTVTANIGTGAIAAGTNAIGDVGVQYRANATGAASFVNLNCPATPVAQAIKASAGRLVGLLVTNTAASARWLKIWNTASGSVTVGTTAALFEAGIPAGQTLQLNVEGGLAFGTAITIAVTGGQGLTNATAVTLGDVTGVVIFA